jgi:hypothetical protein
MVVAKWQTADGGFDNIATAVGAADDSSENLAHFDRWRDTGAQTCTRRAPDRDVAACERTGHEMPRE